MGDSAFSIIGAKLWNGVPLHVRHATIVTLFLKQLKTNLFKKNKLPTFGIFIFLIHQGIVNVSFFHCSVLNVIIHVVFNVVFVMIFVNLYLIVL